MYLSLLTLSFTFWVALVGGVQTEASGVTWISPSEGDSFSSGDTIAGTWKALSAPVSPSLRLCSATDGMETRSDWVDSSSSGNCGSPVWPTVTRSKGLYVFSIAAPSPASQQSFYLEMKDDFGGESVSPAFTIYPASLTSADAEDPPYSEDPQLPLAPADESSPAISTSATMPPFTPPVPTQESAPSSTATSLSSSFPSSVPYFTSVTRTPPPVAAFAVPLSFVGAIVLLASAFSFRHWQNLKAERARNEGKLTLTGSDAFERKLSCMTQADAEHGSVSLYAPTGIRREPRRSTREPFFSHRRSLGRHYCDSGSRWTTPFPPPPNDGGHADLQARCADNGSVTSSVILDYLQPLPTTAPTPLLSAPRRLHTRSEATPFPAPQSCGCPSSASRINMTR